MANFVAYQIPQYRTTTLNKVGGLDASETTNIVLASIPADLDITAPGICALTYSNPINTSTIEWITYTSIDGTNELQGVTRGAEDWTAKTHLNGCTIGFVFSKSHVNEIMKALTGVTTGVILNAPTITATNAALTTPKITTSINDSAGNEVIKTPATSSAVNEITVTNAATGGDPLVSATGGDTDINLAIKAKGAGLVKLGTAGLKFPNADGTTGQYLKTDGSGVLSFTAPAGSLSSKLITSTRDMTATGAPTDVAYTGVGFQPTAIYALATISASFPYCNGFADSSKTGWAMGPDAAGAMRVAATYLLAIYTGSTTSQIATVKTYDADGFTLTWTKSGSPTGTATLAFLCFR
jgi:hypothetical protein